MLDSAGRWIKEDKEVGEVPTKYFKNLFQTSNPHLDATTQITSCLDKMVSEEQKDFLEKDFTKEELEKAIKITNPSKAPGPDGARAMFF